MGKKQYRKYTHEYKQEAVRLMMGRGTKSVAEVATELGVQANQLYAWRQQYGQELGYAKPSTAGGERSEEQRELEALRRENRELKRSNEFLKKAAAFFAKEQP